MSDDELMIECPNCGEIYFIHVDDVDDFRCDCEDDWYSGDDPMERNMEQNMLMNIGMGD